MGLDTDSERKAVVIQRAWLVAMSGAYANTREVEGRLVALGYREAQRWLRDPELQHEMDDVCAQSRAAFLAGTPTNAASGREAGS